MMMSLGGLSPVVVLLLVGYWSKFLGNDTNRNLFCRAFETQQAQKRQQQKNVMRVAPQRRKVELLSKNNFYNKYEEGGDKIPINALLDELKEENNLQEETIELPVMFSGEKNDPNRSFDMERWQSHRSPGRYVRLLLGVFFSVTTRRVFWPLFALMVWSGAIKYYNGVGQLYGMPEFELPLEPFELTAPVLGLLLVFRSNTAFDRFNSGSDASWEITNLSKTLVNEILSYTAAPTRFNAQDRMAAYDLADACVVLHGWLMRDYLKGKNKITIREQERFLKLALGTTTTTTETTTAPSSSASASEGVFPDGITDDEIRLLILGSDDNSGTNIPSKSLTPSSGIAAISLGMTRRLPGLDFQESTLISSQLNDLQNRIGMCEKLLRTPIPLGYTRYTVRFCAMWLSLLPFALVRTFESFGYNTWWEDKPQPVLLFAMVFIGFIFLSIEDISVQIEEPFTILPMELHQKWLERDVAQIKNMNRLADRMNPKITPIPAPTIKSKLNDPKEQQIQPQPQPDPPPPPPQQQPKQPKINGKGAGVGVFTRQWQKINKIGSWL